MFRSRNKLALGPEWHKIPDYDQTPMPTKPGNYEASMPLGLAGLAVQKSGDENLNACVGDNAEDLELFWLKLPSIPLSYTTTRPRNIA